MLQFTYGIGHCCCIVMSNQPQVEEYLLRVACPLLIGKISYCGKKREGPIGSNPSPKRAPATEDLSAPVPQNSCRYFIAQ